VEVLFLTGLFSFVGKDFDSASGTLAWLPDAKGTIVSTGDTVDRGPDDEKIQALFKSIKKLATAGQVLINLMGNHEELLLSQEYQYHPSPIDARAVVIRDLALQDWSQWDLVGRFLAPDGRVVVALHGGLEKAHLCKGGNGQERIDELNKSHKIWTACLKSKFDLNTAEETATPSAECTSHRDGCLGLNGCAGRIDIDEIKCAAAPIWDRKYWTVGACELLEAAMPLAEATTMVIGHTIQERGITRTACGSGLEFFGIDVGMSRWMTGRKAASTNPAQLLEFSKLGVFSVVGGNGPKGTSTRTLEAKPKP